MKRKSILMTIVAVLFAGVAWGQLPTTLPGNVKGSDTIYFCYRADSLYPLELGYDVPGKSLHPSYGNWTLHAKTVGAFAADYSPDASLKNDGAGNAFQVINSSLGGFIFQYEVISELCGLKEDESFWSYVFIFPDLHDGLEKDTIVCFTKNVAGTKTVTLNDAFKKELAIYDAAGFTHSWKSGVANPTLTVKTDSVAIYTLKDTLEVAKPAGINVDYNCGDEIPVVFRIAVDTIGQLKYLSLGICDVDTLAINKGNESPNIVFNRIIPGTYIPDSIGSTGWTKRTVNGKDTYWKSYQFKYKDCDNSEKSTFDTLYLLQPQGNWGIDTLSLCRDSASYSVFTLYNDEQIDYPRIPVAKPYLIASNSLWFDRGTNNQAAPATNYGTVDGNSSLNGYNIASDNLKSNVAYHYMWRPAGIPCLVTPAGVIDSGKIVFILKDKSYAQDYTAQLCKIPGYELDLSAYAQLSTSWDRLAKLGLKDDKQVVRIDSLPIGTYKYGYELLPGCGPGGKGVFYIKVTDKIKSPKSKTVVFCYKRLPAGINANDILGVAVNGLKWKATSTTGVGSITTTLTGEYGFDSNTGILDITQYVAKLDAKAGDSIVFEVTSGDGCGVTTGTTVTIKLVDNILAN
jgi:hypothetical protein